MKRKIFSKLLMGALLVASVSSFVSCKDYDDDINNLQDQINAAALKSDLSALQTTLASVQTTASGAASTAQSALEKAGVNATDIAAIKATATAQGDKIADAATQAAKGVTDAAAAQAAANAAQSTADAAKADAATAKAAAEAAQAAATAAKADADAAIAKAIADLKLDEKLAAKADAADLAALTTKVNGLATDLAKAQTDLAAAKALADANAAAIATLEAGATALEARVAALEAQGASQGTVEAMEWAKAVTSVELFGSIYSNDAFVSPNGVIDLLFFSGKQVANDSFGKADEIDDPVLYEAGKDIVVDNPIIVRVNPINATFDKSQVKLIDGEGNDISEYAIVDKVEPYEEIITRAGSKSGLWKVTFVRNNEKTDADYKKATKGQGNVGQVLYALAIANDTTATDRYVASTFDLGIVYGEYVSQHLIGDFQVNGTNVSVIKNRWKKNGTAYYVEAENGDWRKTAEYNELTWIAEAEDAKTGKATGKTAYNATTKKGGAEVPAVTAVTTGDAPNATIDTNDARWNQPLLKVNYGEPIVISNVCAAYNHIIGNRGMAYAQYYYIVLDSHNAIESYPSELNAWNGYTYTGLGELTNCKQSKTITITANKAIKDIIGFRLFAVNYDGTLVDPDGKAFYVQVGDPDAVASAVPEVKVTGADEDDKLTAMTIQVGSTTTGAAVGESEWIAWNASAEEALQNLEFDKSMATVNGITNPVFFTTATTSTEGSVSSTRPFAVTFNTKADGSGDDIAENALTPANLAKIKSYKITYIPGALVETKTYAKKIALIQTTNNDQTQGDTIRYIDFAMVKTMPTSLPGNAKIELLAGLTSPVKLYAQPITGTWTRGNVDPVSGAAVAYGPTSDAARFNLDHIFKSQAAAPYTNIYLSIANADSTYTVGRTAAGAPTWTKNNTTAKAFEWGAGKAGGNTPFSTLSDNSSRWFPVTYASNVDNAAHAVSAIYAWPNLKRLNADGSVITAATGAASYEPAGGFSTGISFTLAPWSKDVTFGMASYQYSPAWGATSPYTQNAAVTKQYEMHVKYGTTTWGWPVRTAIVLGGNNIGLNAETLATGGLSLNDVVVTASSYPGTIVNTTLGSMNVATATANGQLQIVKAGIYDAADGKTASGIYSINSAALVGSTGNQAITLTFNGDATIQFAGTTQYIIIEAANWLDLKDSNKKWTGTASSTAFGTASELQPSVKITIPVIIDKNY